MYREYEKASIILQSTARGFLCRQQFRKLRAAEETKRREERLAEEAKRKQEMKEEEERLAEESKRKQEMKEEEERAKEITLVSESGYLS